MRADTSLPHKHSDVHIAFGYDGYLIDGEALLVYLMGDPSTGGSPVRPQTLAFLHAAEALMARLVARVGSVRVMFFDDVAVDMHPVARLLRSLLQRQLAASKSVSTVTFPAGGAVWSDEYTSFVRSERPAFVLTLGLEQAFAAAERGLITERAALCMGALFLRTVTVDRAGVAMMLGVAHSPGASDRMAMSAGKSMCFCVNPVWMDPFIRACSPSSDVMQAVRALVAMDDAEAPDSGAAAALDAVVTATAAAEASAETAVLASLPAAAALAGLAAPGAARATAVASRSGNADSVAVSLVAAALARAAASGDATPEHADTLGRAALLAACVSRSVPLQTRAFGDKTLRTAAVTLPACRAVPDFVVHLSRHLAHVIEACPDAAGIFADAAAASASSSSSSSSSSAVAAPRSVASEPWADVLDARLLTAILVLLADVDADKTASAGDAAAAVSSILRGEGASAASSEAALADAMHGAVQDGTLTPAGEDSLSCAAAQARAIAATGAAWSWLASASAVPAPGAAWGGLEAADASAVGGGNAWRGMRAEATASMPEVPSLPAPVGEFNEGVLQRRLDSIKPFLVDGEHARGWLEDAERAADGGDAGVAVDEFVGLPDEEDPLRHMLREDDPFAVEHFSMDAKLMEGIDEAVKKAAKAAAAVAAANPDAPRRFKAPSRVVVPDNVHIRDMTPEQRAESKRIQRIRITATQGGGGRNLGLGHAARNAMLTRGHATRTAPRKLTAQEIQKQELQRRNKIVQRMYAALQTAADSMGYMNIPKIVVVPGATAAVDVTRRNITGGGRPSSLFDVRITNTISWLEKELDRMELGDESIPGGIQKATASAAAGFAKSGHWSKAMEIIQSVSAPYSANMEAIFDDAMKLEAHLDAELMAKVRSLLHRRRLLRVRLTGDKLRIMHARLLASYRSTATDTSRAASAGEASSVHRLLEGIDNSVLPAPVRAHLEEHAAATQLQGSDVANDEIVRAMGEAYTHAAELITSYDPKDLAAEPASVASAISILVSLGFGEAAKELATELTSVSSGADASKAGAFDKQPEVLEAFKVTVIRIVDDSVTADAAAAASGPGDAPFMSPQQFQLLKAGAELPRPKGETDSRVPFKPDRWQVDLLNAVDEQRSCLITAPTSSGKTFVCYYALQQALRTEEDQDLVIYVAPNEQLVYQCMTDVIARYTKEYPGRSGWDVVGAFTRETRARINHCQLLATTPLCAQVLLQAAHSGALRRRIRWIIFDEVHMLLEDPAWEQALLTADCAIIALSATVGEPERFASWLAALEHRRGRDLQLTALSERWNDLETFVFDVMPPREEEVEEGAAAAASSAAAGAPAGDGAAADKPAASTASADGAASGDGSAPASGAGDADEDDEDEDGEDGDAEDALIAVPKTGMTELGTLCRLHPIATLAADEIAAHGIPAGTDLLPEQSITLHRALTASVDERLAASGADGPSDAARAVLTSVAGELATSLHPDTFAWGNRLHITLREAHTYARRVLRRLARVGTADKATASRTIAMLAVSSDVALERTEDLLTKTGEFGVLCANLRGLLMTLKRRRMLPALCFRLERRRCQQLAQSLCLELDHLEYMYRQTPEFLALKTRIEAARGRLNSKLAAAKDRRPKNDPDTPTTEEQEVQEQLNMLPATDGVDARFAFADTRSGGSLSIEDLRTSLANKRLKQEDVMYNPKYPMVKWRERALQRGIAFHHAGVSKKYRRAVEALFRKRRLSVVFCTSTLALGINMPCRSVVFVGDSPGLHRMAYRQMAGRAGRRGHDNRGNVIFMGLPSAKVNKLVTCSVPRLLGTQVLNSAVALRMSLQHKAAGIDIQAFGELETESNSAKDIAQEIGAVEGRRIGKKTMALYPGGPLAAPLPSAVAKAARSSAVATTQRLAECSMMMHRSQSDFDDVGTVVEREPSQYVTALDVDSDDEGSDVAASASKGRRGAKGKAGQETTDKARRSRGVYRSVIVDGSTASIDGRMRVVRDLTAEAAAAEDAAASAAASGSGRKASGRSASSASVKSEHSAVAGTWATPVDDPAAIAAEETAAGSAWTVAPRMSSRLALAFIQQLMVHVGALAPNGMPRGLAGLVAALFHCGPASHVFAGLIANGTLCAFAQELRETCPERDDRNIALLELTACFFSREPLTPQLVERARTGEFATNMVVLRPADRLPAPVTTYVNRWNAMARIGFARYLRAAASGLEDVLPPSSNLPLSGNTAGRVQRGLVPRPDAASAAAAAAAVAKPGASKRAKDADATAAVQGWEIGAPADGEESDGSLADDWEDELDGEEESETKADDAGADSAGAAAAAETAASTAAAAAAAASAAAVAADASAVAPKALLAAIHAVSASPALRSSCSAITGLGDEFASVEDLVINSRPGLRPDVAELPVVDVSEGVMLNRFAVDFFETRSREALEKDNMLSNEVIYTTIEAFAMDLRRIAFAVKHVYEAEKVCKPSAEASPAAVKAHTKRVSMLEVLSEEFTDLAQRYLDRFNRHIARDEGWVRQYPKEV